MLFYLSRGSSRKGGAVVTALASHQCSQDLNPLHHIWVEFVVTSLPCSLTYFSGYSDFPSQKLTFPHSNSIWIARTHFDEFLRTPKCFTGKHVTVKLVNTDTEGP